MKKHLVILAVCILAAAGVTVCLTSALLKEGTDVTVEETTLKGDASVMDGRKMTVTTMLNQTVKWDTSFTAGEEEKAQTRVSLESRTSEWYSDYDEIYMNSSVNVHIAAEQANDENEITAVFRNMIADYADQVAAGENGTFEVPLNKYFTEFAPVITISGSFLNASSDVTGLNVIYYNDNYAIDPGVKSMNELAEKLALPVDDVTAELEISVDETGTFSDADISFELDPFYAAGEENYLALIGDTSADYVYFILTSTPAGDDDPAPVSEKLQGTLNSFLDGSGIYRVPIGVNKDCDEYLVLDKMELLIPFDPSGQVMNLHVAEDNSRAYLLVNDADGCSLLNINLADKKTEQKFPVTEKTGILTCYTYDVNAPKWDQCYYGSSEDAAKEHDNTENITVLEPDQTYVQDWYYCLESKMAADPEKPRMFACTYNSCGNAVYLVGDDGSLTEAVNVCDPDLNEYFPYRSENFKNYENQEWNADWYWQDCPVIYDWDPQTETLYAARKGVMTDAASSYYLPEPAFYVAALKDRSLEFLGAYSLSLENKGTETEYGYDGLTEARSIALGQSGIAWMKFSD